MRKAKKNTIQLHVCNMQQLHKSRWVLYRRGWSYHFHIIVIIIINIIRQQNTKLVRVLVKEKEYAKLYHNTLFYFCVSYFVVVIRCVLVLFVLLKLYFNITHGKEDKSRPPKKRSAKKNKMATVRLHLWTYMYLNVIFSFFF